MVIRYLYKLRWVILIGIAVGIFILLTGDSGYAVSYDEVMDNMAASEQYFNRIVIYVEPTQYEVRTRAQLIIDDAGDRIDRESAAWKIWSINYWVSHNIEYVVDPPGGRYTNAYEVLLRKCGDCDDFSILLASMYESVGLDAALVFLNTDENPEIDHMACLVYWPDDIGSFLGEEKDILREMRITSPVSRLKASHIFPGKSNLILGKYDKGVLLFTDVLMSEAGCLVGYITVEPYEIKEIIDVGR